VNEPKVLQIATAKIDKSYAEKIKEVGIANQGLSELEVSALPDKEIRRQIYKYRIWNLYYSNQPKNIKNLKTLEKQIGLTPEGNQYAFSTLQTLLESYSAKGK
jgi:hypothetical protein